MQPKNNYYFFLSLLAVFLFLAASSLQAHMNERTGIPFSTAPREKSRKIKKPAHFLHDGKMAALEQPLRQPVRSLSKRTAGQAVQYNSNGLIFVLDTAIAYTTQDTSRYSFSYSANGWYISYVYEQWTNGQWVNSYRGSFT